MLHNEIGDDIHVGYPKVGMHPGASDYQWVGLIEKADAPGCIPTI